MASSSDHRRLFFALWPEEALRIAFAHATHKAVKASGGRPVPAHNLHATLLFLGMVAESRVSDVKAIGARAATELAAVAGAGTVLRAIGRAGIGRTAGTPSTAGLLDDASAQGFVFDRIELWKKPQVLVATTSAASGPGFVLANALVGILRRETIDAGFAPDLKPFRAHVTVARKVARMSQPLHMEEVRWPVTGLALVESVTLAEGPRYGVLDSWVLSP